jgi:alginate O-acetyltransferase complex protein AlgI
VRRLAGVTTPAPAPTAPARVAPAARTPEDRARPDLRRFLLIAAQLALVLAVVWLLRVDQREGSGFLRLCIACFGGFAVHYLAPFRLKKQVFLAVSLVGAAYVLWPQDARKAWYDKVADTGAVLTLVVGLALLFFWILRLRIAFAARAGILALIGAALWFMRREGFIFIPSIHLPNVLWAVIGSIFMFRLIVFAYEVRVARRPESLLDYLTYMLLLPNFYFPLFPVVDYSAFKRSHYAMDIHECAQRGIAWIVRGMVQLMLLNVVRHNMQIAVHEVVDPWTTFLWVFSAYLIYLRVSGYFHIIVGMLHLFGYALPETHRRFFLAHSFMDFWRRINIYWKDFMMKCFFYPVYFRLRKRGETLAMVTGTAVVFAATTVLHSYQFFWILGQFDLTETDLLFWGTLGGIVIVNMLLEQRAARRRKESGGKARAPSRLRRTLQIVAMYVTISIMWSIWSTPTIGEWWDTVALGLGIVR